MQPFSGCKPLTTRGAQRKKGLLRGARQNLPEEDGAYAAFEDLRSEATKKPPLSRPPPAAAEGRARRQRRNDSRISGLAKSANISFWSLGPPVPRGSWETSLHARSSPAPAPAEKSGRGTAQADTPGASEAARAAGRRPSMDSKATLTASPLELCQRKAAATTALGWRWCVGNFVSNRPPGASNSKPFFKIASCFGNRAKPRAADHVDHSSGVFLTVPSPLQGTSASTTSKCRRLNRHHGFAVAPLTPASPLPAEPPSPVAMERPRAATR
mmetsp:Transcript_27976/g.90105  ORF Transcript_27976/g.90105 Transcript_27976/m.90105 type:complete len:270 (-) Transcript_27976:1067-1876(-)